ncbi:repetitive organellar protein-like [Bicyclus anynana]|uniref:Repetitive organellar protein-like n=1 Tax=Bicyclus anynana TaxID=110368 RepID=A0ABM3LI87_BICAN|nr:repetitive organellar protein-like [Bicyclus anynana]
MCKQLKISIYFKVLHLLSFTSAAYLEAESNYVKPKLERNNIVNKGLWIRNNRDRKYSSDFIFRANSLDVDNVLQNNYDAFGQSNVANSAFFSGFNMERSKRSADENENKKIRVESANNYNRYTTQSIKTQNQMKKDNSSTINYNSTTNIVPKRSMNQRDYESENELIKKIEFTEDFNSTNGNINGMDRSIFDKADMYHNARTPNINVYKIIPEKEKDVKNKPLNERGVLKVLSMLTKTFKKVMKQHHDIKRIHNKLYDLNDEFTKNAEQFASKFKDFNSKYFFMVNLNEELKRMEIKLKEKDKKLNNREEGLTKNLKEFENHQRNFLEQQRQFYNVQKTMLAQNEKINLKQNAIAKTQNEISRRQHDFARILKKDKQVYMESRKISPIKVKTVLAKQKIKPDEGNVQPIISPNTIYTTISPSPTTETVKINLFSIPTLTRLENQDQMILDEKDNQPVDELIYKYYFNNTFIDDIMRNKILATLIAAPEAAGINKNKRNENIKLETTHLIAVNKTTNAKKNHRNRRWIKFSKNNHKKYAKASTPLNEVPDVKTDHSKIDVTKKVDPFITMALSFCKEVGQNVNIQVLNWCVEKALRRLKVIGKKCIEFAEVIPLKLY